MIRLAICSDSTSFWVRPHSEGESCSYNKKLASHSELDVSIYSRPGLTSREALSLTWNDIAPKLYDAYFYSFGINDVCLRSYPKWMSDRNNRTICPNSFYDHIFSYFYRCITAVKIQRFFSSIKLSRPWVSKINFSNNIKRIIEIIQKEEDSTLIFTTIPEVSPRVESILHGTNNLIKEYNEIIRGCAGQGVYVIDLEQHFSSSPDRFIPEGIHYTCEGHEFIVDKVSQIVLKK